MVNTNAEFILFNGWDKLPNVFPDDQSIYVISSIINVISMGILWQLRWF